MRVKLVRIINQNQCNSNKMVGQSAYLQLFYRCNATILLEVNKEEKSLRHVAIIFR